MHPALMATSMHALSRLTFPHLVSMLLYNSLVAKLVSMGFTAAQVSAACSALGNKADKSQIVTYMIDNPYPESVAGDALGQQGTLIESGTGPARMEQVIVHGGQCGSIFSSQSANEVPSDDPSIYDKVAVSIL